MVTEKKKKNDPILLDITIIQLEFYKNARIFSSTFLAKVSYLELFVLDFKKIDYFVQINFIISIVQ